MWPSYLDTARANCILNTGYAWCSVSYMYPEYSIHMISYFLSVPWILPLSYLYPIFIQDTTCILSIYRMFPVSYLYPERLSLSYLYPGYYLYPICILFVYRILSVSYLYPGYYLYPICIVSLGINSNPDWPLCHEFTKMSHCVVHRVLEHRQNFL